MYYTRNVKLPGGNGTEEEKEEEQVEEDRRISTASNNDVKGCIEERVILDTGSTRATH